MRGLDTNWLLGAVLCTLLTSSCKRDPAPSSDPIQIAKREAQAFAALVSDGEHATDCAAAVAVMQADFDRDRAAFVASAAQTADAAKVKTITDYAEAHPDELPDNDERWDALFQRCKDLPAMKRLGAEIMFPNGPAVPERGPEPPR
ncbi:MAG TPA: hypothetical protein VFQ65_34565 [Kofleriaceae bacterium]|nr:hypothetical protein [Kofleriaceae bacterium]